MAGAVVNCDVVRWVTPNDHEQILRIDRLTRETLMYDREPIDIKRLARRTSRSPRGIVLDATVGVLGYCFYRHSVIATKVVAVGIDPRYRLQGVATSLLKNLVHKSLAVERIERILMAVDERDTELHLWLRYQGCKAIRVERQPVADDYIFEYQL